MKNTILESVKNAIREPYAWPGGYPVFTIMDDGAMLCPECARANYRQIAESTRDHSRDGWQAIGADVYWEGSPQACGHCGKPLESAYGDPDSEGGE